MNPTTAPAHPRGRHLLAPALPDRLRPDSAEFENNRIAMLALLAELSQWNDSVIAGGSAKSVARHRERGKLLVRERIDLLLDRGSPFLELSPLAAHGTRFAVGASVVTGIGVVAGTQCMIIAHDPTVRGGTSNPYTWRKVLRAMDIARENRLTLVNLVESGGGDLSSQAESFVPAGRLFHDISRLSSMGVATVALVFGNSTAGGAYVPGMCDYSVLIRDRSHVFLGGPPLVKMATGEDAAEEDLGGALMHTTVSGVGDYLASDEHDCIRIGREIISHLKNPPAQAMTEYVREPLYDTNDLIGTASADPAVPFDPRDVIARIVDGSQFEEYKPRYGISLVTGWAEIWGYRVGFIANHHGVLYSNESRKATEFILLCNQQDIPIVFLQNTTGYIVGTEYERGGIIKDGAKMINAVTNSSVPHITINIGSSYGAGNYGMCGRSYSPRFLFSWPNARLAVMGPAQLAGVLSLVRRQNAERHSLPFDEADDAAQRHAVEDQITSESTALAITGQVYDDGIIDPRDTRTVLGICLSSCHNAPIVGNHSYGVFRM